MFLISWRESQSRGCWYCWTCLQIVGGEKTSSQQREEVSFIILSYQWDPSLSITSKVGRGRAWYWSNRLPRTWGCSESWPSFARFGANVVAIIWDIRGWGAKVIPTHDWRWKCDLPTVSYSISPEFCQNTGNEGIINRLVAKAACARPLDKRADRHRRKLNPHLTKVNSCSLHRGASEGR